MTPDIEALAREAGIEPSAWGFPNTAITGGGPRYMMLRHQFPSDDQYGGVLWHALYPPAAVAAIVQKAVERAYINAARKCDEIAWTIKPELGPEMNCVKCADALRAEAATYIRARGSSSEPPTQASS